MIHIYKKKRSYITSKLTNKFTLTFTRKFAQTAFNMTGGICRFILYMYTYFTQCIKSSQKYGLTDNMLKIYMEVM